MPSGAPEEQSRRVTWTLQVPSNPRPAACRSLSSCVLAVAGNGVTQAASITAAVAFWIPFKFIFMTVSPRASRLLRLNLRLCSHILHGAAWQSLWRCAEDF